MSLLSFKRFKGELIKTYVYFDNNVFVSLFFSNTITLPLPRQAKTNHHLRNTQQPFPDLTCGLVQRRSQLDCGDSSIFLNYRFQNTSLAPEEKKNSKQKH